MSTKQNKTIHALLTILVIFDLFLVVWVIFFPDWWFWAFHGSTDASPDALLFLRRCGANWAAFLLFQFIAWRKWKEEKTWLAVVAGIRLSDIFTDPTVALLATKKTWFLYATLPAMGFINLCLGVYFFRAYKSFKHSETEA